MCLNEFNTAKTFISKKQTECVCGGGISPLSLEEFPSSFVAHSSVSPIFTWTGPRKTKRGKYTLKQPIQSFTEQGYK